MIDKDHGRDKLIGVANIDLSPLLTTGNEESLKSLDAWFPIYNVDFGLRGDIKVHVKLYFMKE